MGFVKSYIQMFAYGSATTDEWKNYLFTYFKDKVDVLNQVDWHAWMFTPGMPPVKPQYDTTLADACIALSQRWIKATEQDLSSFQVSDMKPLSSHQVIEFLSLLLQEAALPLTHVKKMQEVYDLNASKNAEIRFRWLRLCVRSRWEEAVPMAMKMATDQGRMKFTRPLFIEVFTFDKYRDEALRMFQCHRGAMHPVTAGLVAKDLKIQASSSSL
ncbi:leukotriene A-4 hydrolase-like [Pseudochaenichthys georgianus]|uniref:leukotriene A-4 hydrolase-like n=1 Tax=Pseudochaenichthys georgianus TaxID=52239 RepID=UPI0039C1C906